MHWAILSWSCRYCFWIYTPKFNSRRLKRQHKNVQNNKTKRQAESKKKKTIIKTVSNKLCPASAKTILQTRWWRKLFSPPFHGIPHFNSCQKWSALVHHHHQVSLLHLFNTLYVFLLWLDRLAPPAGERLEWRCIPNQIKGETVPLVPPKGLKLESDLGLIR